MNTPNTPKAAKYPEVAEIKQNLQDLGRNARDLAGHVKEDGFKDVAKKAQSKFDDQLDNLKSLKEKVEDRAKEKPGQTVALAFVAGLIANFFLRRR